ncbi:MAG: mannose-1-phosphate guanylyltransferase, partial [Bdellovibrionia bacterium]
MIPVVLSGGSGTRLWPLSRAKLPKQFCSIFEHSLHTMTLRRLTKLGVPWVVTSKSLRDLTIKNMNDLGIDSRNLVLEPIAKNTAPAIALLTYHLLQKGLTDEVIGIFPADHIIENEEAFLAAVHLAKQEATSGKVVTLGIKPEYPATGYGYIQTSKTSNFTQGALASYSVEKFHEKPCHEKAISFLQEGSFYWNAGIFVFTVATMAKLLEQHQPSLWKSVSELNIDLSNIENIYSNVENISIDYAIMEKLSADRLSCVPCDIGWNDVGSWDAIAELLGGAHSNNKIEVQGQNNFVQSTTDKTYAFVGVDNLIIVDTADATLITQKGATQSVKEAVDILKLK